MYDILLSFFIYGFLGWCAEVAYAALQEKRFVNRGFLNGPICPIYGIGVTAVISVLEVCAENLFMLYLVSALLVTALEWATGFLLEKIFHHKWWDYSDQPLNIQGYICVPFSLMWGAACVLIVKVIHPVLYKASLLIPVWLGSIFLAGMSAILAIDIYVTVTGILKFNRRLVNMEEVAEELHRLSDQLGENIYQNMMAGMEKREQIREKTEELKERYEELLESQALANRRIFRAFPKMHSGKYEKQLAELKEHLKKKGRH